MKIEFNLNKNEVKILRQFLNNYLNKASYENKTDMTLSKMYRDLLYYWINGDIK